MKLTELDKFKLDDAIKFHEQLNPMLFQNESLKANVRQRLLEIAEDFIEYLGVPEVDIKDVTISGSNAAYTYTRHSDIDLHILVDMNSIKNDRVYEELFKAKKNLYNEYHDILIYGFEVELYVQDSNEPVISLGEYSVLNDKWIRIPKKRRSDVNEIAARLKFEKLGEVAEAAIQSKDEKKIDELLRVIKRYRQAGLDKHGEFGPENLAFKVLRSRGIIDKLYQTKNDLHDERLSLPEDNKLLDKPTPTVKELAKKHKVSTEFIVKQLDKGIKIELEHTSSRKVAKEIASDHLNEDPKYYIKLAKVELEESTEIPRTVYHVTLKKNLGSIMSKGLIPKIGDRSQKIGEETPAIYCFKDKDSVHDALMNWLGDELEEDEEITLLAINTNGLAVETTNGADYEIAITSRIPPSNIKVVSDLLESILLESSDKTATHLQKLPKFFKGNDPLAELIPERKTHTFALHPDKWQSTFYSLTNKDPEKLRYYRPAKVEIVPGTLVGDMVFANQFYRAKTDEEKLAAALNYKKSLKPYDQANVDDYRMPELLIPRSVNESASGYIPSKKEANDPRFKTALTVDIKPDTMQKNAAKLGSKIKRNGVPPLLR